MSGNPKAPLPRPAWHRQASHSVGHSARATVRFAPLVRILFGPLTGVEVLGTRIEGSVVVIECAFSINVRREARGWLLSETPD